MNTTELIICNSVSLIVFASVLIKFKINLDKVKRDYRILKGQTSESRVQQLSEANHEFYNQKCRLEDLVEAQSKKIEYYQQVLKKD